MKRKEFAEDINNSNTEEDSEERWFDSEEDSDMYEIEEGVSSLSLDPPPTKKALSETGLIKQLDSMRLGGNDSSNSGGVGHERKVVYCGNGVFVADEDPEGEGAPASTPSLSDSDDIVLPSSEDLSKAIIVYVDPQTFMSRYAFGNYCGQNEYSA